MNSSATFLFSCFKELEKLCSKILRQVTSLHRIEEHSKIKTALSFIKFISLHKFLAKIFNLKIQRKLSVTTKPTQAHLNYFTLKLNATKQFLKVSQAQNFVIRQLRHVARWLRLCGESLLDLMIDELDEVVILKMKNFNTCKNVFLPLFNFDLCQFCYFIFCSIIL